IGSAYENNFIFSKQYSGYVAALRVHSGALSADDVSANYSAGINGMRAVYALPASDIAADSAKINGYLTVNGANVTVFYGDVDGGTDANSWGFSDNLGVLNAGYFSDVISGLWDGQQYLYRIQAVKDGITYWSDVTGKFTTATPPTIENGTIKETATVYAKLNANLTSTNWGITQVRVYVGTTDGGDDPAGWEKVYDVGICSAGTVEARVSNLQPGTTYYYRFYAENPAGGTFATSSSTFATAPYFDRNGYQYFSSFNFSGYTLGETLTNFPALVVLSPSIQGFSYDQFQSGNADLRFTDFNGTELKYEIEKWDTTGNSYVWLRVPELTNNAMVYMFWGKPGVPEPSYRTDHSVWSDGFVGVWHMTNKYCLNAAANNYNIDTLSNPDGITDVQGKIGTAQSYVPTSYGTAGDLDLDTNITISAWVWANNFTAEHTFIGKGDSYLLWSTTGSAARWEYNPWGGDVAAALPGMNQWIHLTATWDGVVQKIYVNGALSTYWTKFAPINKNDNLIAFGHSPQNGRPHNGYLDECRVEVVPRSANWIKACYLNQNNPGQFITFTKASWLGEPISFDNLSASSVNANSAILSATLLSDGAAGVTSWGFAYDTVPSPTANVVQFSGATNAPFTFSANISGLSSGTHYYYRAWASNASVGVVYSADKEFYTEPNPATSISFSGVQNNKMTINWTKPAEASGNIVVVREGLPVVAVPTDGIVYNANSSFEQGFDLGGGSFVVYDGSGNQVTVTDLVPGKTYYVAVYTYCGSGTLINYLTSASASGSQQTANYTGQLMVAGKLLIDINAASGLKTDASGFVSEWVNYGSIGGSFVQDATTPANPGVGVVENERAVIFYGTNHLKATFTAPREITGLDSQGRPDDYTIEAWVYNPVIASEEWIFSWGKRGTENRCAAFGYGSHGTWGALGHWGAGDVGYGTVPVAHQWHHIVAVYDGAENRIYV
ncbi:MAG TPA: DUF2341 domain-containing protein, partial [Verrucomicrobiota bacterium]|nr:DUF2341 domain-containing protein [Verrucomicrobiota bacterium]